MACAAAAQAGDSEYGEFLLAADAPYGGTFFKYKNMLKAWAGAGSLDSIEVPLAPTADRSRVLRRVVSSGKPIPEEAYKALKLNLERATPSGPRAWHLYWSRTLVEPINGASTARMFSSAERRAVLCETGQVLEAGAVYFAALDTSGEPYGPKIDYRSVYPTPARMVAAKADLAAEVRAVCTPILSATYGEEDARARLDALLTPPPKSAEMKAFEVVREQMLALARAATEEAAADAAPKTENSDRIGVAKARVRLFQQNGLGGGLTNEAACASDSSMEDAGSGFFKSLGSTFGIAGNTSIGMPETETSRTVSDRSKMASKAYFVEQEVSAGAPVTVDYAFGSPASGQSCSRINVSFIPEAGADYEVRMDVGGRFCRLIVNRILPGGALLPEPLMPAASECPPAK